VAYTLHAVIAAITTLPSGIAELPGSGRVELNQGFALIPVPDDLFEYANDGEPHGALGFWRLPPGLDDVLSRMAVAGPVAYVEAEYFGPGTQRAVVWKPDGTVVGPILLDEDEPFPADGSPISHALRILGARHGDYFDEFDAVGLDRHRGTEDWIS
jgi:hypothetical protein